MPRARPTRHKATRRAQTPPPSGFASSEAGCCALELLLHHAAPPRFLLVRGSHCERAAFDGRAEADPWAPPAALPPVHAPGLMAACQPAPHSLPSHGSPAVLGAVQCFQVLFMVFPQVRSCVRSQQQQRDSRREWTAKKDKFLRTDSIRQWFRQRPALGAPDIDGWQGIDGWQAPDP